MPANSLIVGVDLAPIKPIPRAITFQGDITTEKCRATIRQHLKTWKADTVLHDGAPNVGVAWVQDAFSQAELALQALKLATEFLIEGGTFVTKVFRSKDYNALLWVLNQLFNKVEATKPPSSRNVSAEIFVVCRGFKAPRRIDTKFLDPRAVFAELSEPTPNNEAKVFNPEKKKRKREGYAEGDYTQFKEASVSDFIETNDPIAMLGSLNRFSFDQSSDGDVALAALNRLPETTKEVRECCQDLKVLGRKEFRLLLRWRLKAREIFGLKATATIDHEDNEVGTVIPMDEELRIQEEMNAMNEKENYRRKRERKRENERKQKEIIRMQLHMSTPREIGLEQAGPDDKDSMFALSMVDRAGAASRVSKGKMAVHVPQLDEEASTEGGESDPEEDRIDLELDELYNQYQERKSASDAKHRAKKSRKEYEDGEWEGFTDHEEERSEQFEEESSDSPDEDAPHIGGPFLTLRQNPDSKQNREGLTERAAMFFQQEIFRDIEDVVSEDAVDSAIHIDSDEDSREKQALQNEEPRIMQPNRLKQLVTMVSRNSPEIGNDGVGPSRLSPTGDEPSSAIGTNEEIEADFEVVKAPDQSQWGFQGATGKDSCLGK